MNKPEPHGHILLRWAEPNNIRHRSTIFPTLVPPIWKRSLEVRKPARALKWGPSLFAGAIAIPAKTDLAKRGASVFVKDCIQILAMLYDQSIPTGGIDMKFTALTLFAAALILTSQSAAGQSTWNIDPAHSAAQFEVRHLMISNVRGEFGKMTGTVSFDGKDYSTIKAEAVIEVASINTREQKRDADLRSSNFFDAATYPTIRFKSKRVENIRGGNFNLVGDLTMRGVTKEISLNVTATLVVKGMGGESRIGAHATAAVNRQDYGIKWNRSMDAGGVVVGDEVQTILDLELVLEASGTAQVGK